MAGELNSFDQVSLHRRFGEYPLVLEVRHSSWADEAPLGMLAEFGIGFCNIDQPLLGNALKPTAETTSAVGYVRLHGRNYQNWFAETNGHLTDTTTCAR